MTEQQLQQAIDQLFESAGLKRVVSLDDMYGENPTDDALILAVAAVEPAVALAVIGDESQVSFEGDKEVRDEQLRKFWNSVPIERKRAIIDELRAKSNSNDDTDLVAKDKFSFLFANQNFQRLSLENWEKKKEEILKGDSPVLFLVDEDFTKEGRSRTHGRNLVREILNSTDPDQVMCGLVSHNYLPQNVHEDRDRLCSEEHFDPNRFVLIPKVLADDDLAGFASLIKLAVVAKPLNDLQRRVTDILIGSLGDAEDQLKKINVYDMEEIVFQSSFKEGVWEPETLVRVYNLYVRLEARKALFAAKSGHNIAKFRS